LAVGYYRMFKLPSLQLYRINTKQTRQQRQFTLWQKKCYYTFSKTVNTLSQFCLTLPAQNITTCYYCCQYYSAASQQACSASMWPIATDAEWSWLWAVLKRLNQSWCCLGCRHEWVQGSKFQVGAKIPPGKRKSDRGHLPAHCEVLGSQTWASYSGGGSSNAAFRCQYYSNLFVSATTTAADSNVFLLHQKNKFLELWESTICISEFWHCSRLQRLGVLMWTTQQI